MEPLTELVRMLHERIVPAETVYPNQRIALILPGGALDVMKVAAVGYVTGPTEWATQTNEEGRTLVAVAKNAPGQASVLVKPNGEVILNGLRDTADATHASRDWHADALSYPSDYHKQVVQSLGPLAEYRSPSYWVELASHPLLWVTRTQMRTIQQSIGNDWAKYPLHGHRNI